MRMSFKFVNIYCRTARNWIDFYRNEIRVDFSRGRSNYDELFGKCCLYTVAVHVCEIERGIETDKIYRLCSGKVQIKLIKSFRNKVVIKIDDN